MVRRWWWPSAIVRPAATAGQLRQGWPTKTVRVIVPFAPGSATDLVPRAVFEQVQSQIGQTFVIENRPGGGTTTGTAAVAKSDPDGHTMLVHSNGFVTTPAIQTNVPYDPVRDFAAITPLANVPMVLVISPEKKIKTLQELVAYAKANPGKLNYAAAGIGTPPHLTMERLRVAAGFTGQLVPFKGAPEALTEVLAGRVDVYFWPLPPARAAHRERAAHCRWRSRASSARRAAERADDDRGRIPEFRFRFLDRACSCPSRRRATSSRASTRRPSKALQTARMKERFHKLGVELMIMTPEAFDARIAQETRIAVELAKATGIANCQ